MHQFALNILEVAGGIAVSVLLPALARSVRREFLLQTTAIPATPLTGQRLHVRRRAWQTAVWPALIGGVRFVWPVLRPYLKLACFSLITAIVILAFLDAPLTSWRAGFAAGYLWDSTLQKISGRL